MNTVKHLYNDHSKKTKNGFQDELSLNAGQKYCRMLQGEHSAILSTFIKLPFAIKVFVLSIFELPFYTGFTVYVASILGHWLDMVYLPPRGNFEDHIFLKAQCLASIFQHVSPLTMAALSCNSLLHTLPYKIFDN